MAEIRSKSGVGLRKVDRARRGTTTRLPGQPPRRRVSIAKMTAAKESSLVNRLQSALAQRRGVLNTSQQPAIEEASDGSSWASEDSDFE